LTCTTAREKRASRGAESTRWSSIEISTAAREMEQAEGVERAAETQGMGKRGSKIVGSA